MNMDQIVRVVAVNYPLALHGIHGVTHWARVMENGLRLAEVTGANPKVVQLFALFHDSKRSTDRDEPAHGRNGAALATSMQGLWLGLSADELALLQKACTYHTIRRTDEDVTIQTCWDSDRLDLGRCGRMPDPYFLNTSEARRPEVIDWAFHRGRRRVVPSFVRTDWGFDL